MRIPLLSLLLCLLFLCQTLLFAGCTKAPANEGGDPPASGEHTLPSQQDTLPLDKKTLKSFVIVAENATSDHVITLATTVKNACGKTPDIVKPGAYTGGNAFLIGDYAPTYSARRYGILVREENGGTQILLFGSTEKHQILAVEALLRDYPLSEQSTFPRAKILLRVAGGGRL